MFAMWANRCAPSYGPAVQAARQPGIVRVERHQNDIAHTEAERRRAFRGRSKWAIRGKLGLF